MSSAGAQCDHMNHVTTQIPYVAVAATVSFIGYCIAGVVQNPVIVLAVCLVAVYVALTYLVTRPLGKIRAGVDEVSEGNLDVRLSYSESSQEMSSLTTAFNDMAHELADVYAGLEDEVADRTAQLQQANEVLEQQRRQLEAVNAQLVDENQYKSDFLSMVSHELRTPLTSIVAFADLLSKHRAGADENEAKALAGIEANSQALMLMINDILEMSRLDAMWWVSCVPR